MNTSFRIDRRAFLRGIGGAALALPALDAMGAEVTDQLPRRFCALYTANGMSLPKEEHGLDEWAWFPRAEANGEFAFGKSTEPLSSWSYVLATANAGVLAESSSPSPTSSKRVSW